MEVTISKVLLRDGAPTVLTWEWSDAGTRTLWNDMHFVGPRPARVAELVGRTVQVNERGELLLAGVPIGRLREANLGGDDYWDWLGDSEINRAM